MVRTLLATGAGLVAMLVVVVVFEAIGHAVFPAAPGIDLDDPAQVRSAMTLLPPGALFMVLLGWASGAATGAWLGARLAREHRFAAAMSVGLVMLLLVVANLVMLPHPWWMAIGSVLLPLPSAWIGWRLAR